jgi:transcription elongation factor S-II
MEDLLKLTREVTRSFESKDEELALDVLRQLDGIVISKEALQAAGLGVQLARLSKAEWSARAAEQARGLVSKWKAQLKSGAAPKAAVTPTASFKPAAPAAKAAAVRSPASSTSSPPLGSRGPAVSPVPVRAHVSEPEIVKSVTGVRKRDVIIAKLAGAMSGVLETSELGLTRETIEEKAAEVEALLERDFAANPHAHKTKFLMLLRNLRDNSDLRLRLAVGHLECAELMALSAAEMAPEHVQNQLKDLEAYNKEASKSRKPTGEITRQFGACGKCKCPTTSYFMMQTRSADEPMTIFITCTNCGHSWRK